MRLPVNDEEYFSIMLSVQLLLDTELNFETSVRSDAIARSPIR